MSKKKPSKYWNLRRVGRPEGGDQYQLLLATEKDWDMRVTREGNSWFYNFSDVDWEDVYSADDYPTAEKAMLAAEWFLAKAAYAETRRQHKLLEELGYTVAVGGKLRRKSK